MTARRRARRELAEARGDRRGASTTRSRAWFPQMLRRVGGYNIDVFHPQSVRPYTADGSVNFAHLLVGSRRHARLVRARSTLQLAPAAAQQGARRRQLSDVLRAAMAARAAHRDAEADRGRAGRPHDDRAGARRIPAFRPIDRRALIGEPDAILLVEFTGDDADAPAATPRAARRADGRPRPAGQRSCASTDAAGAEGAVGRAQGRPQHHDVR